jgi:hypothetical protein
MAPLHLTSEFAEGVENAERSGFAPLSPPRRKFRWVRELSYFRNRAGIVTAGAQLVRNYRLGGGRFCSWTGPLPPDGGG